MDNLSTIPQENIIDHLLERFERGQIYTWIGTLLLAINPDGEISTDNIYDLSRANDLYDNICDVFRKEVVPHIFAVAARARYRIVEGLGKPSQVIILNGETGAGKTFNAWRALEFLTTRNIYEDKRQRQDIACCDIVQRIADACRLMSAFTLASTERNEISSRHVELLWLEYKLGRVCGAMISSYLLERNRVTMSHCNFQIFSQMMTALTDLEFADTGLSGNTRYLMTSDLDPSKKQQLRDGLRDTLRAMDTLGFTQNQKKNIFQVLSLLIHMSDIRFTQEDDHCRINTDDQQSKEALENTCKLARLQKEDVVELLTSTLINPQSSWRRHTAYRRNLNTEEACRSRLHSIIRHLYDLLFHWLINSINGILSARLFSERLGILDIFGIECFDTNGMEQLCINYVNERLQQYFIENLEFHRKNLQEEGLIEDTEPPDIVQLYEDRLNTIEKRLFATLNDVCLSTVPSDSSTLTRQVSANGCPETRRFLKVKKHNFVIQHFAGAVEYSINDLLSKNIDKIPDEITVTFGVSKNTFLYCLLNKSKLSKENGKAKKPTMLSKLRSNVDSLIRELNNCDSHYVRCIKLRRLNNREWDQNELRKQLINTGILDILPLTRCKYPFHFTYKEFCKRYCFKQTSDFRVACKKLLECRPRMDGEDYSVHYGKHFVFLKEHTFLQLESARKQLYVRCVRKIEYFWLRYRNRRQRDVKGKMADDEMFNFQNEQEHKPFISMGICVRAETHRQQNARENTSRDDQAVNNTDIQNESTKKDLLKNKYDVQLIDYFSIIQGKPRFKPPNASYDKRSYIIRWLENKEDVHVIRHDTITLFYKNGILSRRRPARLPVRVHTRLTCLTNSHYLVHTELPQGLQDCL
ncbi:myosin-1-like isoform X2 [Nylanderia fulva]|uniref:myosin-1-like isoform X2 n=1 Tax=Nylanderia fulva TaxID=613905 RepID=UPI0010FAFF2C|nr:myosin-1-like isoform X2 [Nylanderia fulva]